MRSSLDRYQCGSSAILVPILKEFNKVFYLGLLIARKLTNLFNEFLLLHDSSPVHQLYLEVFR